MTETARDWEAILARYADGPAELEAAVAGLSEADLDLGLSAGGWTIRQIVHHLADGDDLWKIAIQAALGNSGASFSLQWYWDQPQDAWAENWHYANRPVEPSLALLRVNRRHTCQLVQQIPDAWNRHVLMVWPNGEKRRITVGEIIEMQAEHMRGHLRDIRAIRETHGV